MVLEKEKDILTDEENIINPCQYNYLINHHQ